MLARFGLLNHVLLGPSSLGIGSAFMSSAIPSKARAQKQVSDRSSDSEGRPQVELVQADNALISLRASGHDYCSAIGEVFDNSIQANANNIPLRLLTEKKLIGDGKRKTEVVERVAIGDDG